MATVSFGTTFRSRFQTLGSLAPVGTSWRNVGFAMRTTAASLVALYVAFLLDLDNPKWAAMTVWIVAQSSRGMSLSKSRFRIIGTVVGATVAVTLIALFAQIQEMFIPALGLWLALCTGVATGWRNFRAYGAVLAGYTAAIISLDAVTAPQDVFQIAVARVVYICLGIATEAVFTAVFAPDTPLSDVHRRLTGFLDQAARLAAQALRGGIDMASRERLIRGMLAIDVATEYAAASYFPIRARFGHLRSALMTALAEVAAAQSAYEHLERHPGIEEPLVDEAASLLERRAEGQQIGVVEVDPLRSRIEAALAEVGRSPAALLILDRLDATLCAFLKAEESAGHFTDEKAPPARITFAVHVDHTTALHNAIRSFVAVVASSAVWIATAWPAGGGLVSILCVVCALFATRPNPVAGALGFLKGCVAAVLAAALCNFAIVPRLTDFVPYASMIALFLIVAGIAMRSARLAAPASSFAFLFLDLLGPDNTHRTDPAAFLNGSLALLMGIGTAAMVFSLVFPSNQRNGRRRLWRAVRRDLVDIGRSPGRWSSELWLSKSADRIGQQAVSYSRMGSQAEADLRALLAALAVGDAAIRLNEMAQLDPRLRKPVDVVLRRLASAAPDRLTKACQAAAYHLSFTMRALRVADNRSVVRASALLREIAASAFSSFPANAETGKRDEYWPLGKKEVALKGSQPPLAALPAADR